ncbi:MAG: Exonuclease small subunit [Thermotogaceae bacterium]|nr:Exonuclease small subunit [Thermotogaceae bacterium]
MATKKKIEELLEELTNITKELEQDDISLEDSIKKYQYAVELYKKAQKQLKESEIKIEEIRGSLEDV